MNCQAVVQYLQTATSIFYITSNLGNYTLIISYGDGGSETRYVTDGVITASHNYTVYGTYNEVFIIPLIPKSYSCPINVLPGLQIILLKNQR